MTPSEEPPPPYSAAGAQRVDTSELQRRQEVRQENTQFFFYLNEAFYVKSRKVHFLFKKSLFKIVIFGFMVLVKKLLV